MHFRDLGLDKVMIHGFRITVIATQYASLSTIYAIIFLTQDWSCLTRLQRWGQQSWYLFVSQSHIGFEAPLKLDIDLLIGLYA